MLCTPTESFVVYHFIIFCRRQHTYDKMICKLLPSALLSTPSLLAYYYRFPFAHAASAEKENEVKAILQRMESDVLAFKDEIERAYEARCETKTLTDCINANFNDCSSTFPGQQCMEANELVVSACGDGVTCNGECTK